MRCCRRRWALRPPGTLMGARAPRLCLLLSCFSLCRVEPAAEFKRAVKRQGEKGGEPGEYGAVGTCNQTGLGRVIGV